MGATASTIKRYNEVVSSKRRGETFIPIQNLNEHIRMFQHQTDGDILMLIDKDAEEFLKDSTACQYQEIFISRRGTEYLDQLNVALSFQATKALMDKATRAVAVNVSRPSAEPGEETQEIEKEPTLYQTYLKENPHVNLYAGSLSATLVPHVASAKDTKKGMSADGHKKTEREEIIAPLRTTNTVVSAGASAVSVVSSSTDQRGGVLNFSSRSMSVELGGDTVPPLLALSRSADLAGEPTIVSNVSSLSRSIDHAEVSRGTAQPAHVHTSSTAAANFLKHEQEQLAKLARDTSVRNSPPEEHAAAPKSARGTASVSGSKAEATSPLCPAQAIASPSTRLSPRGDVARGDGSPSVGKRIAGTESGSPASPGALTASPPTGGSVAPSSGMSSRADSKVIQDAAAGPVTPPEPVPFRNFVPTPYLPPGQQHRARIAAEDNTRMSTVDSSRILYAGAKDELNNISSMTMTFSTNNRGGDGSKRLDASFTAVESKHGDHHEGVKLSPRAMSLLSATADSKPPSLRALANLNSNTSSSTIVHGATAMGIADFGLASTNTSMRPQLTPRIGVNTSLCPSCGQALRNQTSRDMERYDSHVSSCTMRKEMRSALANIDLILEPKLEELADSNRKQLNMALSTAIGKAADEFDQTTQAHAAVKRIVTSVLRVTYDTSAKKICRVEEALNALMDKFNQEHIDALALSQQGNAEAQRRVATLTNLLRILTHTADKLSQKWHNIVMYKKYLIGVQDLCMLRKLGKGSFASVYLARMVDTQQMYAVKVLSKHHVLSADLYQQVMMERTAAVMASRYPNYFVTLQYAFQNTDELFFVMEYMQGGDCLSLLSSVKRLPEHVAQHLIVQVSMAVKHLHQHGVIHRDIKPDNVMITSRGHAKLGDFGSVFPIHPDFRQMQPQQPPPVRKPAATEGSMQLHSARSDNAPGSQSHQYMNATPSSVNSRSVKGQGALVSQFAHEISAAAASAFRMLPGNKNKGSSSGSVSLWLDEESESLKGPSESQSGSNNWSSNSTSSLFFNKGVGGPMMQNTFDIVGNYFYASPEMAGGTCVFNQSVDWWAVGVMLFHMLTGTTPFEGLTKASTLENIERMHGDWDALPDEVTPGCKDFLFAILTQGYETRLGSGSSDEVLGHHFFANIHFPTLYDGYGPYYPRPPSADESSPDFYCFSAITQEESMEIPRFAPTARDDNPTDCFSGGDDFGRSRSSDRSGASQSKGVPLEDDLYQDFDFHPFN